MTPYATIPTPVLKEAIPHAAALALTVIAVAAIYAWAASGVTGLPLGVTLPVSVWLGVVWTWELCPRRVQSPRDLVPWIAFDSLAAGALAGSVLDLVVLVACFGPLR